MKLIDYLGLFPSGPNVSLTANEKESLITSGENYYVTYNIAGAKSCEMVWHNSNDGSSGRLSVQPNTTATGPSGLIGNYTLTFVGPDGATASKSVRIIRPTK